MPSAAEGSTISPANPYRRHCGDDAVFGDESDVVDDLEEIVEHLGDGMSAGNAVGDRCDRLGVDHPSRPPRQGHRRRTGRLDRHDFRPGRQLSHHVTDTTGERTATQRQQHGVESLWGRDELEADRPRSLTGSDFEAVLDQRGALDVSELPGEPARDLDVGSFEVHGRTERAHPGNLHRVRRLGSEHRRRDAAANPAERQRLAEVAGARTHDRRAALLL